MSRDPIGEEGGRSLYVAMSNCCPCFVDSFGESSFTSVVNSDLFYTWHMGWIDKSHAYGNNGSLKTAWEALKGASPNRLKGFILRMAQTGKTAKASFCVAPLMTEDERKGQLLHAWQVISRQFESYQGKGLQGWAIVNRIYGAVVSNEIQKVASTFSSEDLVSNLVNFYSVVDEVKAPQLIAQHAGLIRFTDPITGEVADHSAWLSMVLWGEHPVRQNYQEWEPDYFDHAAFLAKDFSKKPAGLRERLERAQALVAELQSQYGAPTFPAYFQKYTPTSKGVSVVKQVNE